MHKRYIEGINKTIMRTGKAVIGIGCSFVEGQGAIDQELYETRDWKYSELGHPMYLDLTLEEAKKLTLQYPSLELIPDHYPDKMDEIINCRYMGVDNSFTHYLANTCFGGEYAAINLGISGCGNRASIRELYYHPDIKWDKLEEIIVIYSPSGLERFDFVNDNWSEYGRWVCMWPHHASMPESEHGKPVHGLWKAYNEALHSEKFEVLEQIGHAIELKNWCDLNNAQLIITPGFDRRYTREHFTKRLRDSVERSSDRNIVNVVKEKLPISDIEKYVDLFPWNNMFYPDGYPTFMDLAVAQERDDWESTHFYTFLGKGSAENWVTLCAHPSAKAHALFAGKLYERITKNYKKCIL